MHLAVLLAFITFFGWGTGDLFTVIAVRKIGANLTTFWIFFFSFLLSLLVLPFVPHDFGKITFPLLLLNIFLGILFVYGNILISEAFRISSAPLIGVIIPSFPAIVLVLSAIIYHDRITPEQTFFIIIILTGVALCSLNFKELKKTKRLFDRGTALALIAISFLSLFFTFSRILIERYGWFLPTFIAVACFPLILVFIKQQKEKMQVPKNTKVLLATFMVAMLIRSGDFAFNYGLSLPDASSIVAPIANSAPVLFVIISYFIFKDKLTRQQVAGIVITLIGLMLLTAFGQ
jgi:drug/metabolite transporter (DMT)-like permease